MIDIFALVLPHMLMAIAVIRLMRRDDLDHDPALTLEPARTGTPETGDTIPGGGA